MINMESKAEQEAEVSYTKVLVCDGIEGSIRTVQRIVRVLSVDDYGNVTGNIIMDGRTETRVFKKEQISYTPYLMELE